MATWAKNTSGVIDKGFGGSRGGYRIEGGVIHHGAGVNVLNYVANANSRDSHPTYHVSSKGKVTGIVHPNRRPFSTAHTVDKVAITFEIDNSSTGGDWPVSGAALDAVIDVLVDHARQGGYKKIVKNTPGKDQPGVFFIGWHLQYSATACPGPYLLSKMNWTIKEANRRLSGATPKPDPKPAPTPPASSMVLVPGRETPKLYWPEGQLMLRIQAALANRTKFGETSRYPGMIDGVGGELTAMGIQRTLNISKKNGVKPFIKTPIDGRLGINNGYGVQHYAKAFGGYTGHIDGDPRSKSWTAFAIGLEKP